MQNQRAAPHLGREGPVIAGVQDRPGLPRLHCVRDRGLVLVRRRGGFKGRRVAQPQFDRLPAATGKAATAAPSWQVNGTDPASRRRTGPPRASTPPGTAPTLQAKLTASDGASGDLFGWSVAVDGDTAVVGAFGDDTAAGLYAGSAYAFRR